MTAATGPVAQFIADLADLGVEVSVDGLVARYVVRAAAGPYAGCEVETAVAVSELAAWPVAPPHWVHLPAHLQLSPTNPRADETLPGWQRHSRQFNDWPGRASVGRAWLQHVQRVLLDLQAQAA